MATLSPEVIRGALRSAADLTVAPVVTVSGDVATLVYVSDDAHAERVSSDVEALRSLPGLALAESWAPHDAPLVVCLRYVAAPVVAAPRPIAPAPVPATPHRRR